jgi:transcription elongation factor Elf1
METRERKYQLSGVCTNCGHKQTVIVEWGYEKPPRVTCNACGCSTVVCSVPSLHWSVFK